MRVDSFETYTKIVSWFADFASGLTACVTASRKHSICSAMVSSSLLLHAVVFGRSNVVGNPPRPVNSPSALTVSTLRRTSGLSSLMMKRIVSRYTMPVGVRIFHTPLTIMVLRSLLELVKCGARDGTAS